MSHVEVTEKLASLIDSEDPQLALLEQHLKKYGQAGLQRLREQIVKDSKEYSEQIELLEQKILQFRMGQLHDPQNLAIKQDIQRAELQLSGLKAYLQGNQESLRWIDELLKQSS